MSGIMLGQQPLISLSRNGSQWFAIGDDGGSATVNTKFVSVGLSSAQ